MEHRGSQDDPNRKVRIRLKTDPPRDPATLKVTGKGAMKKEGEDKNEEAEKQQKEESASGIHHNNKVQTTGQERERRSRSKSNSTIAEEKTRVETRSTSEETSKSPLADVKDQQVKNENAKVNVDNKAPTSEETSKSPLVDLNDQQVMKANADVNLDQRASASEETSMSPLADAKDQLVVNEDAKFNLEHKESNELKADSEKNEREENLMGETTSETKEDEKFEQDKLKLEDSEETENKSLSHESMIGPSSNRVSTTANQNLESSPTQNKELTNAAEGRKSSESEIMKDKEYEVKTEGKQQPDREIMKEHEMKTDKEKLSEIKSSSSSLTYRVRQSIEKLLFKDSSQSNSVDKIKQIKDEKLVDKNRNDEGGMNGRDMFVANVSIDNVEDKLDGPGKKVGIKVKKKIDEEPVLSKTGKELEQKDEEKRTGDKYTEGDGSRGVEHDSQSKKLNETEIKRMSNTSLETEHLSNLPLEIENASKMPSETAGTTTMLPVTEQASNIEEEPTNNGNERLTGNAGKTPIAQGDLHGGNEETATDKLKHPEQLKEKSEEGQRRTEDPGKRKDDKKDDDTPGSMKRTTRSEDLKIEGLKKRVRPGQVFIVKGESDSFSVRWAQTRKVFAYKVGSKNTGRFSTLLIETMEQLEKASVRHPSLLSELNHPTGEKSPKLSLLSAYLAEANARRSARESTKESGTNTDHHRSPDTQYWAVDHLSPNKETFGGAEQVKHPPAAQINSAYPYLSDYDANHERNDRK